MSYKNIEHAASISPCALPHSLVILKVQQRDKVPVIECINSDLYLYYAFCF